MLTRRAAMLSAAAAVLMLATPALADELKLPRQKVELVAPPFVHAHEQALSRGRNFPKTIGKLSFSLAHRTPARNPRSPPGKPRAIAAAGHARSLE